MQIKCSDRYGHYARATMVLDHHVSMAASLWQLLDSGFFKRIESEGHTDKGEVCSAL